LSRTYNFARRPFQDDRPVFLAAGALFLVGAVLLVANLRVFVDYRRQVADTRAEIAALEERQTRADQKTEAAKAALSAYQLSSLADESRGLARLVAERRFSWTLLLSRLERVLPYNVGVAYLQPRFEKDGDIWLDMQFNARKSEAVVETIAALAKDPAFGEVNLRSETSSPDPGAPDPFHFLLSTRYEPAAAPAREKPAAREARP
jgi:hypothetical protein